MSVRLTWDEAKRRANLARHGLDFADAWWVLESRYRLDAQVMRGGEMRTLSFSYVVDRLAVLALVHLPREEAVRIVSFRHASAAEMETYRDWIEKEAPGA
jgi:uncharacterized protein